MKIYAAMDAFGVALENSAFSMLSFENVTLALTNNNDASAIATLDEVIDEAQEDRSNYLLDAMSEYEDEVGGDYWTHCANECDRVIETARAVRDLIKEEIEKG